jgi:hypothetical protein
MTDLPKLYTVVKFDKAQNRAYTITPNRMTLDESKAKTKELKDSGELAMSMHISFLSCIDILEAEQFEGYCD